MTTAFTQKLRADGYDGVPPIHHSFQNLLPSRFLPKHTKIKIQKSISSLVVLHTCEIWSPKIREEHGLRVFQNRVLRWIFGPKRQKIT
jgi:hypothetical protein